MIVLSTLLFWFYRAKRQTDSHTYAAHRLSHGTFVGVSNYVCMYVCMYHKCAAELRSSNGEQEY